MKTEKKLGGVTGGIPPAVLKFYHPVNYSTTPKKCKELIELEEKLINYIDKVNDLHKMIKHLVKKGDAEKLLKCHRSLIYCERKEREISKKIKALRS